MLQPGDRVAVAVSGGPDSVALLWALTDLRDQLGIVLSVVHVNHGLRGPESDQDEAFTRDLAQALGLDCLVERLHLPAGENLEQAARNARLAVFRKLLDDRRASKVATGHTRTDQAETVLFRLLRGAGSAGLTGIHPVLDGRIVRPLIEIERPDVLAYLQAAGRAWREDSSNRNLDLRRNRLRHELLPELERHYNPAVVRTLAHLAGWARDEEQYWQAVVLEAAARLFRLQAGVLYLNASASAALPPALERRVLRHAIQSVRGDLLAIDFAHIEQIRQLTAAAEGHGRVQLPGIDVFRSFDQIRIATAGLDAGLEGRNFSLTLVVPGTYDVPHSARRLILELREPGEADRRYNKEWDRLDWERVPRALCLRNWRPGDLYQPMGRTGPEKLKSLFHERRVPLWERRHWPVIASETELVWARGFGAASRLAAGPDSRLVLEITEVEGPPPP